jgi:hypothetical protein
MAAAIGGISKRSATADSTFVVELIEAIRCPRASQSVPPPILLDRNCRIVSEGCRGLTLQTTVHESAGLARIFRRARRQKSPAGRTFVTLESVIASIVSHCCPGGGHAAALLDTGAIDRKRNRPVADAFRASQRGN